MDSTVMETTQTTSVTHKQRESPPPPALPRPIVQLPEAVVNRIAAGEVVARPVNAVKELLENSIDAGSTRIQVLFSANGAITVSDNGCGIQREDLPILCKRFTTSKLRSFDDLQSIMTHGFRGEALASISHVARLTVTTMTEDSQVGYRCEYMDGEAVDEAQPTAATPGTTIHFTDLFYNLPTRRRSLMNTQSEEYARIVDLVVAALSVPIYTLFHQVSRFAAEYYTIAFTCRNARHGSADISSPGGEVDEQLKVLHFVLGDRVAKDLIELPDTDIDVGSGEYTASVRGFLTHGNSAAYYRGSQRHTVYSGGSTGGWCTIFINGRLVECAPLRKAIGDIYSRYLPKGQKPGAVHLSFNLPGECVDVNVHPTKKDVTISHMESLIEGLQTLLDATLKGHHYSRTYTVPVTGRGPPHTTAIGRNRPSSSSSSTSMISAAPVRVDNTQASLTTMHMYSQQQQHQGDHQQQQFSSGDDDEATAVTEEGEALSLVIHCGTATRLMQSACSSSSDHLTDLLTHSVWVGPLEEDNREELRLLIQHKRGLYLVEGGPVLMEAAYQQVLRRWGSPSLSRDVAGLHLNADAILVDRLCLDPSKARLIVNRLTKPEMLSLIAEAGLVLNTDTEAGVVIDKIPDVIVPYPEDIACIEIAIARLLVRIWAQVPEGEVSDPQVDALARILGVWAVQESVIVTPNAVGGTAVHPLHQLWLRYVSRPAPFQAPQRWAPSGDTTLSSPIVRKLVELDDLYKVFERC